MGERGMISDKGLCPFTFGRVADRVYSVGQGWGVIHRISYHPPLMGLVVNFDNGLSERYTLSGYKVKHHYDGTDTRDLFWGENCLTKPLMPEYVLARNTVVVEPTIIGFGG